MTAVPPRRAPAPRLTPARERIAKEALAGGASATDAARLCGLSRSYFISAFAATAGLPPHRWARELRLLAARRLLVETQEPIAVIAGCCGFSDQSHLTRAFRARWGRSPALIRRDADPKRD